MRQSAKKAAGRPRKELNAEEAEKLYSYGCADADVAGWFNVSLDTVQRRVAGDPAFRAAKENGQGKGRANLRSWQYKAAENGNATMLIWLGKQYLGQADKVDVTHERKRDREDFTNDELRAIAAEWARGHRASNAARERGKEPDSVRSLH